MNILVYVVAVVMGFLLGLLGGGGSILNVPALVYLAGIEPIRATAFSLFIVGTTAFIGTVNASIKKQVHWASVLVFAMPSLVAVWITRKWIVPTVPNVLLQTDNFTISKNIVLMLLFAVIMMLAAQNMIVQPCFNCDATEVDIKNFNFLSMISKSVGIGFLTSLVGAGGGFLIVPALITSAKLPFRLAVGSSLTIIAINSLIGFISDAQPLFASDWKFLLSFTLLSILGIIVGNKINKYIKGAKLKKIFGWFTLIIAVLMVFAEFFKMICF
ncbi:MAG: sulfite exporter TauE/SafE family protein [Cytophagales bacterium]|nr:sulfite exporter TauE/SafE family protein [Cytophagales bacterium]MDW8385120.1 sulfite exporter TauE/SafE family protein [Flammeovirgaceae bacterium]